MSENRSFYVKIGAVVLAVILAALIGIFIRQQITENTTQTIVISEITPSSSENIDTNFLELVNFEHRTSGEFPNDMVLQGDAFGEEVIVCRPDGYINRTAAKEASRMFKDALKENIPLYVLDGAYRSVEYQSQLFASRLQHDPNYANDPYNNPVKCMPGDASEHTTGLAMDVLNSKYRAANEEYGKSEGGIWLAENAHKYGFIIRYPKNKEHITGVVYEPWHIRYVGMEAANEMNKLGMCLEEYLKYKAMI